MHPRHRFSTGFFAPGFGDVHCWNLRGAPLLKNTSIGLLLVALASSGCESATFKIGADSGITREDDTGEPLDEDLDGIPALEDCDDNDTNVGPCAACEESFVLTDDLGSQEAVRYCTSVHNLSLRDNHMTHLEALANLESVDNFFQVDGTQLLASLSGLEGLTHVRNLEISNTQQMKTLYGLKNLNPDLDNLYIYNNLDTQNIDALSGTTSMASPVWFQ